MSRCPPCGGCDVTPPGDAVGQLRAHSGAMTSLQWWRSNSFLLGAVAVLVTLETIIVSSSLENAWRYMLGGAIAVALLFGVAQLSLNRSEH